jgi:hypothetical protein
MQRLFNRAHLAVAVVGAYVLGFLSALIVVGIVMLTS